MKKNRKISTNKMLLIALLVAQGLIMFMIEEQLPPIGIPGAKLGLANIFTLVGLYTLDGYSTFLVVILRILLSVLVAKSFSAIIFSMAGGILSFCAMYFIKNKFKEKVSKVGVSIIGSMFHNLGQIISACFSVSSLKMFMYLPILNLVAIPTGLLVGLTGTYLILHISKLPIMRNINREYKLNNFNNAKTDGEKLN